eukprot:CAMPEP_0181170812 /NCGR_PEP_ID=MMETSP1096-20121128/1567_1 /TAXON_ID=156174 ORGANISM="Chrysochromulina ericina, Strain CCMP281" /NCGR_SAMPLE_ID=MMETSP1096 /ASSEMBLY_ACC=CAM_ASM_000453 /LENGTH=71 /DNA_ID=CAMNT_0023258401 /DNA_START=2112 /DNA_END=2327 /DNA_ORIENTATION=+
MKRAFGRANRFPGVPPATRKAATSAAMPMLTVWMSYGMMRIVSYIASPAFVTPPATLKYMDAGEFASSLSR